MIVTSPVGDFPYRLEGLGLERGRLVLHGRMGAWPARVELMPGDALDFARLARVPLALAGLALVVLVARRRQAAAAA
jgi:hypothetical protein